MLYTLGVDDSAARTVFDAWWQRRGFINVV